MNFNSDLHALKIIDKNFDERRGKITLKPLSEASISEREWAAVRYLVEEWDYRYEEDPS